ncbi:MAG: carboxypeptidase regulatory-like domain-containing protein [Bacteroidales bacterium]|nr:carboxypeptidase regulatory-like domain-containing protein [Bacteroidales bacterium]
MKKIVTIFLAIILGFSARAQVIMGLENALQGRLSAIKVTVVDSLSGEPVSFASVYVIPAKDTTITNFTLSDAKGEATLEEVPYGNYVFRVEMMGYKPFVKERYFRDREVSMGTIRLKQDEKFLEAAVVTDVGNPIVIKKDTVEFNASSFQVGTNAMLKDLLLRMPGMEITDDGKVKFNGEEIDKLTVGGRTFFFGDQSTALNNLPASIVDKVRVIDRQSESTRATGLEDGSREKVLDVGLKKEYEEGWFGNAGVKGGTTLAGESESPLRDNRGALYSGNVLASAYSEKDQLTLIGNGMNINDSNGVVFVVRGSDGSTSRFGGEGLSSAAQAGVNLNTSRIKDVETTIGANYKYGDSRGASSTRRTTLLEDGDMLSDFGSEDRSFSNSLSANMEFQKEAGKVRFHFRPQFSYSKNISNSLSTSESTKGGQMVNSSRSESDANSTDKSAFAYGDVTFRDLGKKDRMFNIDYNFSLSGSEGESLENSFMNMISGEDNRSLKYLSDSRSNGVSGGLSYGEPIGEKWVLFATTRFSLSNRNSVRDAFDAAGRNDYFSSESKNHSVNQSYRVTAQYKFKEGSFITLGSRLNGLLNETYSKSFNVAGMTGEDEWYWNLSPEIAFQRTSGGNRLYVNASGTSQQPGNSSMLPVMNIADPSRPTLGNIYLKPYGNTYLNVSWNSNNKERFSTVMFNSFGNINTSPITYARWYDSDGILYSIPVNSRKNSFNLYASINYTTPITKDKKWFITVSGGSSIYRTTSYQAKGTLAGLDKDAFDYSAFMDRFWGGKDGDLFYGGKSGFAESDTKTYSPNGSVNLRYTSGNFNGRAFYSVSGDIARFSLDNRADMNTMDSRFGLAADYTTKHEFEFDTDLAYAWFRGYASGYGDPEWRWNAQISKNIGAFNLSVTLHDILDQTRNLTHTVTANYEEDTYRLVMGRYILFGVKWNFGKMNAAHSRRAQSAALKMVF